MLGGDGRFFNREAIQIVVKIAAANGFGRIVDRQGRHPVDPGRLGAHPPYRRLRRDHPVGEPQPGGPEGDFGVKYNIGAGGPAPEKITDAIFARSKTIDAYKISDAPDIDIDRLGDGRGSKAHDGRDRRPGDAISRR